MAVRPTVPVKVGVTDKRAHLLHETIDEFLWAANCVVDAARDGEWVKTRTSVLHEEPDDEVRERTRLRRNQTGGDGGTPVGVRLNSGMLNANGVKPLPDSARVGVHAEIPRL